MNDNFEIEKRKYLGNGFLEINPLARTNDDFSFIMSFTCRVDMSRIFFESQDTKVFTIRSLLEIENAIKRALIELDSEKELKQ